MTALLRSELLKIRTTRLWWILAICVFVLSAGFAALPALLVAAAGGGSLFSAPAAINSVYNGGGSIARVLALVVGVSAMAGEYRHRTLTTTYLATPTRWKVMVAKAGALLVFGLLFGGLSVLAGVLAAVPFVTYYSGSMLLDNAGVWASILLGALSVAMWALIGMAVGILIPNLIAAMLVGVGFAYILEPILSVVLVVRRSFLLLNLLPTGATAAMIGIGGGSITSAGQPFPWWLATLVLLGWAVVPSAVGVALVVRRDVN